MPIEYHIDHGRRLVLASASGKLTAEDFFNYQRNVWSLPEVRGFNELVDMSKVEEILSPTYERISELAKLSADMDDRTIATKFAIVASDTFAYGIGQLYEAFRNVNPLSTKKVGVFRNIQEAMDWIGQASHMR
ncbi:MAG: hypothetical protein H6Q80_624 [Deltaproteobacteria bacterium]|nr:hypothetical protein [Deltaproteobacteria bacterium]